jgi:hypothetical protein
MPREERRPDAGTRLQLANRRQHLASDGGWDATPLLPPHPPQRRPLHLMHLDDVQDRRQSDDVD